MEGVVAHGTDSVAVGEPDGALVVVFLRDESEAVDAVYPGCLDNGVEGAGSFVVEDDFSCGNAPGHERIAYCRGLVAAVTVGARVVAAAGDDDVDLTGAVEAVGGDDAVVEIEIVSAAGSDRRCGKEESHAVAGNVGHAIEGTSGSVCDNEEIAGEDDEESEGRECGDSDKEFAFHSAEG